MLKTLRGALAAAAVLGGLAMTNAPASAMPMIDVNPAVTAHVSGDTVQDVRWVCYRRCFWRPNYYRPAYGYGFHRPWGYGFHRGYGYRRWHRW